MKYVKAYFYIIPSLIMLMSGIAKIAITLSGKDFPAAVPGLVEKVIPVAIIELLCAVVFLIPRTANIGFFLVCSYWGGAIAVDLLANSGFEKPTIILILFWIGMYLRKKEIFTFTHNHSSK
jgi:hypothetical protein